jgi:peptidoglycan hydrolase-like protein with peptidoglycan-binding domain
MTLSSLQPLSGAQAYGLRYIPSKRSGAGSSSTSTTPATTTPIVVAFPNNIAYGDTSPEVVLLQTILREQGLLLPSVPTSTYFGAQTEHALLLFQNVHLLNTSGFVDAQSQALLNKIAAAQGIMGTPVATTSTPSTGGTLTRNLGPGSTGTDVTTLQHLLASDGDYEAGIFSSYYGALTEKAVQVFQSKYAIVTYGLPTTTGYGAVGPKTRAKLNSL